MSACEGLCLSGYDIGLPTGGIAYSHPDCPEHGANWMPHDNEWSRDYVAAHPERFSPPAPEHPCCRHCVTEPGEDHPAPHSVPCDACALPRSATGGAS